MFSKPSANFKVKIGTLNLAKLSFLLFFFIFYNVGGGAAWQVGGADQQVGGGVKPLPTV